ncbi:allantoate amidohydrolase [Calidifontibacter sp. DB0510]|uniref:Allantoate amidohydrolase n=1 Tax=Metallococcus carri TaxID=1656884 RepID=A0A967EBK0_9MICO|nr:allantoate amidohydrolase [Metallococcus carri]NHN57034.1 allantoate amidohydrolase [Metallococcus carri]NOP39097.1 allantoate amidohydrolase [Calidifontibacter sp. DB2511S]
MWEELLPVGRDAHSGGYRRFAWTDTDHTLREWFAGECAALGLDLVEDRAGNQWAWWGDPDSAPGLAIGSHLDSVPDGGAYDGPLGVVSSLTAVKRLRDSGFHPQRPIGVVNFGDEEGARFGIACAGSRIITGALEADRARGLKDADGLSLAEAWQRAGRNPAELGPDHEALARVAVFVELHVEQGKALANLDAATSAVAVGTDIWPHGRWRADFAGRADHAGTTALVDREDAMLKAAAFALAAREEAEARDGEDRCVATVGKLQVTPGGVNAIPSRVSAWLDARSSDERLVRDLVTALHERFPGTLREESWTGTTRFDQALCTRLRDLLGPQTPMLGTGAGHDAGILAAAGVPTAMLFVRNPTGTSHSPDEFAEQDDCHAGVDALTTVVRELAS